MWWVVKGVPFLHSGNDLWILTPRNPGSFRPSWLPLRTQPGLTAPIPRFLGTCLIPLPPHFSYNPPPGFEPWELWEAAGSHIQQAAG